jgi:radical SAM superfamily enzyme YgiQ (UPF0313 family)
MKNILFVNTPSCFASYAGTRVNAVVQVYPLLSHAVLAAVAGKLGKNVDILDLGIVTNWQPALSKRLESFKPDMVCMSVTTPLFKEVAEVSFMIRKQVGREVLLAVGGPHATALPEETLSGSAFDLLIAGEGEAAFAGILQGDNLKKIMGVYYREGEEIKHTPGYSYVKNLDDLPFPAFELYDMKKYKCPRILNKVSPMTNFMTSRGCVYKCSFCNKNIFGNTIRYKSPEVVIEEIKYMLSAGLKEIRFIDDMFTTDINRAKTICEMIIREGLKFPWTLSAGIRVDRVDLDFLNLAKRAGLYQVAFGFESGDQKSLDSIDKGIKIEQGIEAMKLVRKAGLESVGFFMLGLPTDTEKSIHKTFALAKKLSPTYAKITVLVPFPGTRLFDQYEKEGRIKSRDWELYNLHSVADIYEHPHLSPETMDKYYNKFYYEYYLNPAYLTKAFWRTLKDFTFFHHIYYGLQTFFPKILSTNIKNN